FGAAERECHAWFLEACAARGLDVVTDGNGNTVAWWHAAEPTQPESTQPESTQPESTQPGRAVLTGSHLDSVLDGGAYDGPLGVVSALAAVDLLRHRGFAPSRSIGVGAFVEEEGSR